MKTIHKKIILSILVIALTACNGFAPKPTEKPTKPTEIAIRTPLPTGSLIPENIFAFKETPQGGQIGGIDGLFVYTDPAPMDARYSAFDCFKSFNLLRFYKDGLVLGESVCLEGSVLESWSHIKQWFHRDTNSDINQGTYYISGNRIWFSTTKYYAYGKANIIIDYSGKLLENMIIVNLYNHYTRQPEIELEYIRMNVDTQK